MAAEYFSKGDGLGITFACGHASWLSVALSSEQRLNKRAANKSIILKLNWLHLLLLPSHSSSKELVEAERAGDKAENMGTEGDVLQHRVVALQAGWEICTVLAFTKPWGQSDVAILIRSSEEGREGKMQKEIKTTLTSNQLPQLCILSSEGNGKMSL